MTDTTKFFDSIYNSRLYSIVNSKDLKTEQKKEKLNELKKEIEEIPTYKAGKDKSFIQSANEILKKIEEELKK